MMILDYKEGEGVKNLGKSDYVICKRSRTYFILQRSATFSSCSRRAWSSLPNNGLHAWQCCYSPAIKSIWNVIEKHLHSTQRWRNHGNISFYNEWAIEINRTTSAQRKKNKKKTVESRDISLMFVSRSTERQAGLDGKTAVIDRF